MDVIFHLSTKALTVVDKATTDAQLQSALSKAFNNLGPSFHVVKVPFKSLEAFKQAMDLAIGDIKKKINNGDQANWQATYHHLRRARATVLDAVATATGVQRELDKEAHKGAHKETSDRTDITEGVKEGVSLKTQKIDFCLKRSQSKKMTKSKKEILIVSTKKTIDVPKGPKMKSNSTLFEDES